VVITYCVLPDPGATTGPTSACGPITLGLEVTPPPAAGISYQWQASTTGDVDADYTATGGNTATYETSVAGPTWFRCRIECTATGAFVLSSALLVSPDPPNAGSDATLSICNTAPPENMFDLLGSDAEPGGTWSGPSPVSNGLFNPATMVAGVYQYTVTGIPPCMDATAEVTVVLDPCLSIDDLDGIGSIRWLGQEADGNHVVQVTGMTVKGWELYDMAGRSISAGMSPMREGLLRIPLANERTGIYIIQLITSNGNIALRVAHEG